MRSEEERKNRVYINLPEKPIDISTLSEIEFDEELEKGYSDMQVGRIKNAKNVFAEIRNDYNL